MTTRCLVLRGLVLEIEQDLNKFLSAHPMRVLHMSQSEYADHVTVTLLFEEQPGDCEVVREA